jgi:hypothetical protein
MINSADAADNAASILKIELPSITARLCTAMCIVVNPLLRGIARSSRLESYLRATPLPFDLYISTPIIRLAWWHILTMNQLSLTQSDLRIECTSLKFVWMAMNNYDTHLPQQSAFHASSTSSSLPSLLATSLSASSLHLFANPNAKSGRETFPAFTRTASSSVASSSSTSSTPSLPQSTLPLSPPPNTTTTAPSDLQLDDEDNKRANNRRSRKLGITTPNRTTKSRNRVRVIKSGDDGAINPVPDLSPGATPPTNSTGESSLRAVSMIEVLSCGAWQLGCRLTMHAIPLSPPNTPRVANVASPKDSSSGPSLAKDHSHDDDDVHISYKWRRSVLLELDDPLHIGLTHATLPMLSQCFDSVIWNESFKTLRPIASLFAGRRIPTSFAHNGIIGGMGMSGSYMLMDKELEVRCSSISISLGVDHHNIATFEWHGIEVTATHDRIMGCFWNLHITDDTPLGERAPLVLTSRTPTTSSTSSKGTPMSTPLRQTRHHPPGTPSGSGAAAGAADDDDDGPGPKPALKFDLALTAREDKEDMPTYIIRLNNVTLTYLQRFSHDLQSWFNGFAQSLTAAIDCLYLPSSYYSLSSTSHHTTGATASPYLSSPITPLSTRRPAMRQTPSASTSASSSAASSPITRTPPKSSRSWPSPLQSSLSSRRSGSPLKVVDNDSHDIDAKSRARLLAASHRLSSRHIHDTVTTDNGNANDHEGDDRDDSDGDNDDDDDDNENGDNSNNDENESETKDDHTTIDDGVVENESKEEMGAVPKEEVGDQNNNGDADNDDGNDEHDQQEQEAHEGGLVAGQALLVIAISDVMVILPISSSDHNNDIRLRITRSSLGVPVPAHLGLRTLFTLATDIHAGGLANAFFAASPSRAPSRATTALDERVPSTTIHHDHDHDNTDESNNGDHSDNEHIGATHTNKDSAVRWQLAHALLTSVSVSCASKRQFSAEHHHDADTDADGHLEANNNEADERVDEISLFSGVSFDASARLQNNSDGVSLLLTSSTVPTSSTHNNKVGNATVGESITLHESHCRLLTMLWEGNFSESGILPRLTSGVLGLTGIVCEVNAALCRATFFGVDDNNASLALASLMLRDSSLSVHLGQSLKRLCYSCEGILIHQHEDDGQISLAEKFVALAPSPISLPVSSSNSGQHPSMIAQQDHDGTDKPQAPPSPALVAYYSVEPSTTTVTPSSSSIPMGISVNDEETVPHPLLHIYARNPVLHISESTHAFLQTLLPFNTMSLSSTNSDNGHGDINITTSIPTKSWMSAEVRLVGASILGIGLHEQPFDPSSNTNRKVSDDNWDTIFLQTSFHASIRRVEVPLHLVKSMNSKNTHDPRHSNNKDFEVEMVMRCSNATFVARHIDVDSHMDTVMASYDDALTSATLVAAGATTESASSLNTSHNDHSNNSNGSSLVIQRLSMLQQLCNNNNYKWAHLFHVEGPPPIMLDSPNPFGDDHDGDDHDTNEKITTTTARHGTLVSVSPPSLLLCAPVGIRTGSFTLEFGRTNGVICSHITSVTAADIIPFIQITSIESATSVLVALTKLWSLLPWATQETITSPADHHNSESDSQSTTAVAAAPKANLLALPSTSTRLSSSLSAPSSLGTHEKRDEKMAIGHDDLATTTHRHGDSSPDDGHDLLVEWSSLQLIVVTNEPSIKKQQSNEWHPLYRFDATGLLIDIGSRSSHLTDIFTNDSIHRLMIKGKLSIATIDCTANVWDTLIDQYNVILVANRWPLSLSTLSCSPPTAPTSSPLLTTTSPNSDTFTLGSHPSIPLPVLPPLDDNDSISRPVPHPFGGSGGPPPLTRWSTGHMALSPVLLTTSASDTGPASGGSGSGQNSPSLGHRPFTSSSGRMSSRSPIPGQKTTGSSLSQKKSGKVFDLLGVSPQEMSRMGRTPPLVDDTTGHLKLSRSPTSPTSGPAPGDLTNDNDSSITSTTAASTSNELMPTEMDDSPTISQSPTQRIRGRPPLFASSMLRTSREREAIRDMSGNDEAPLPRPATPPFHQMTSAISSGTSSAAASPTPIIFTSPTALISTTSSVPASVVTTPLNLLLSRPSSAAGITVGSGSMTDLPAGYVVRPSAEQIAAAVLIRSTSRTTGSGANTPISLSASTTTSPISMTPGGGSGASGIALPRSFPPLTVRTSVDHQLPPIPSTTSTPTTTSATTTPIPSTITVSTTTPTPNSTATPSASSLPPIMYVHPQHHQSGSTLPTIVTPSSVAAAASMTPSSISTTSSSSSGSTIASKVQGMPGRVVKNVLKRLVSWPRGVRHMRDLPGIMLGNAGVMAAASALGVHPEEASVECDHPPLGVTVEETTSSACSPVPTPVPPMAATTGSTVIVTGVLTPATTINSGHSHAEAPPPPYHYFGKPTWPRTHRGAILRAGDANQGKLALRRLLANAAIAANTSSASSASGSALMGGYATSEHYIAHWPNGDGWLLASTRRLYLLQPYDRILEDKRGGTDDKKVIWSMSRNDVIRVESAGGGRSLSIIGNDERHLVGPFLEQSTVHHICVALLRWRYKSKLGSTNIITDVPAHLLDDVAWIDTNDDHDEDDTDSVIISPNGDFIGSRSTDPDLSSLTHHHSGSGSFNTGGGSGTPQVGYLDHSELAAMIRSRGGHSRQSSGRLSITTSMLTAPIGTDGSHAGGRHSRRVSEFSRPSSAAAHDGTAAATNHLVGAGHIEFGSSLQLPGYSFSDNNNHPNHHPTNTTSVGISIPTISSGSIDSSGSGGISHLGGHIAPNSGNGTTQLGTIDDPAFVMSDGERVGTVLTHFHSGPIAIDIIGCRKLIAKDRQHNKSNAYVAVSYDNGSRTAAIKKSTRVHRDINPIFNERFVFDVTNAPMVATTITSLSHEPCVRFRVYHKGMLAKHFLGQLVLSVRDLLTVAALGRPVWLPLKSHPAKPSMKVNGELGFKVDLHPATAAAAIASAEKINADHKGHGPGRAPHDTLEKPHISIISNSNAVASTTGSGGHAVGGNTATTHLGATTGSDDAKHSSSPSPSVRRISNHGSNAASPILPPDSHITVMSNDDNLPSAPSSPNSVIRMNPSSTTTSPPANYSTPTSPISTAHLSTSHVSFSRSGTSTTGGGGGPPTTTSISQANTTMSALTSNAAVDEARLSLITDLQRRLTSMEGTIITRDAELARAHHDLRQRNNDIKTLTNDIQMIRSKNQLLESQLVLVNNQLQQRDHDIQQVMKEKKTLEHQLRTSISDQSNLRQSMITARATESELWKVKRLAAEEKRALQRDMEQRTLEMERERQRMKQTMDDALIASTQSEMARQEAEQLLINERSLIESRNNEADALGTRMNHSLHQRLISSMSLLQHTEKQRSILIKEFGDLSTMTATIQQLRSR